MNEPVKTYPLRPTLIEIGGEQRTKWLQSYVTNDVRKLTANSLLETFATDLKGKCLSHGCVFMNEQNLYFLCVAPDQSAVMLPFWEKYMFIADVTGTDRSSDFEWHVVKNVDLPSLAESMGFDGQGLENVHDTTAAWRQVAGTSHAVVVIQGFIFGPSYSLLGVPSSLASKMETAERGSLPETQGLAAESGFPWFGVDFNNDNLPQEIARDASAISFTKGCYLGQETIARLDALGQVQKKIFSVDIDASSSVLAPQPIHCGQDAGGQPIVAGTLTSAYVLQNRDKLVGWAMLKRKYFSPVEPLRLSTGEVVTLREVS